VQVPGFLGDVGLNEVHEARELVRSIRREEVVVVGAQDDEGVDLAGEAGPWDLCLQAARRARRWLSERVPWLRTGPTEDDSLGRRKESPLFLVAGG